jgi:hypothetical protein
MSADKLSLDIVLLAQRVWRPTWMRGPVRTHKLMTSEDLI